MARQTLEFENLPLVRVEFGFFFEAPLAPSFDELARLRSQFSNELPFVTDFAGTNSSFNLNIGNEYGIGLDSDDHSSGLALRANRLIAIWQNSSPTCNYPRYPALKEMVFKGMKSINPDRKPTVAYGRYINQVPSDQGSPRDMLIPAMFPTFLPESDLVASQFGWRLGEGSYNVIVSQQPTFFILDTQYLEPKFNSPEEGLDKVHAELIRLFAEIITEHATATWKLKPDN